MKPALLLLVLAVPAAADNKPYIPAPVPVNIKPSSESERMIGVGTNRITVQTDWVDGFFTRGEEKVGELETTAHNVAVGYIRSKGSRYTEEWDFIGGKLEQRNVTTRYRSTQINKDVNLSASGSGFDLGVRYLGGYTLHKSERVDWNLAMSMHAAYYRLESTYSAGSTDGLDANVYDSEENGLFLRPAVALQPIIAVGKGVSLVPYVGTNLMVIAANEYYVDKTYRRNGVNGSLGDGEDFVVSGRSFELVTGFDLGFLSPFDKEHKVTLGGALTQLFGQSTGSFTEVHVMYAFPFGK